MIKKCYWLISLLLVCGMANAQVSNSGMTDNFDSLELGKVSIGGYVDAYYGVCGAGQRTGQRPYAVSQDQNKQFGINLAYIDIRYQDNFIRAKFTPAAGTYMNANYAAEPGTFKNIFEANAGIKLSKKKEIWLDAGILGSPFTNETPISKDHLLYTRSFAAEYIPYYLAGARLTLPLSNKLTTYLYAVNGFQQIADVNQKLAAVTQVEYKPTKNLLLNWNLYYGNEQSATNPHFRNRFVCDLYTIAKLGKRFSLTADAYFGLQALKDSSQNDKLINQGWWQANAALSYQLYKRWKMAGRVEYYSDPKLIMVKPVTPVQGFEVLSTTLGFTYTASKNALIRLEARDYLAKENIFTSKDAGWVNADILLIAGLSVAF